MVSHASCPSADINDVLKTLLTGIPSNIRSLLPTEIQGLIILDTTADGPSQMGMAVLSETGAAKELERSGFKDVGRIVMAGLLAFF